MSAVKYLLELRRRLLHCLIVVGLVFAVLSFFAKNLYQILAIPLLQHLPDGKGLIATAVVSPFLVPFKLAFVVSIFITIPFLLFQLWAFVAPALYKHERRLVWLLLASSTLLFYLGALFAYFVVFPLVFGFFTHVAPPGVEVRPDISQYLDFTLKLLFAFGAAFEVPVATVLLVMTGMTSVQRLKKARPYVIVIAFVVGMLLTPPDVISQVLLAVPIWLLFEVGLVLVKLLQRKSVPQQISDRKES